MRQRAIPVEIDGLRVLVASLDDLIASKERLGRPKDRAQLPHLYATKRAAEWDDSQRG